MSGAFDALAADKMAAATTGALFGALAAASGAFDAADEPTLAIPPLCEDDAAERPAANAMQAALWPSSSQ